MASRGEPRTEATEVEATPEAEAERSVGSAVSIVESRFKQKALKVIDWFLDNDSAVRIVPIVGLKLISGIFNFAMKAIQKRGNLTFGEEYKMGQDMLSFEANKKDKK